MTVSTNSNVEGFVGVIRLAWAVHLILTHDKVASKGIISNVSLREMSSISAFLERVCSQNIFQFLLEKVIASAAYKVRFEIIVYCIVFMIFSLLLFHEK
jgi:nuclear pore complex protein Nup205